MDGSDLNGTLTAVVIATYGWTLQEQDAFDPRDGCNCEDDQELGITTASGTQLSGESCPSPTMIPFSGCTAGSSTQVLPLGGDLAGSGTFLIVKSGGG